MKICPVGAELFHVNRRMDVHDEVNIRFSQFCDYTKKNHKNLPFVRTFLEGLVCDSYYWDVIGVMKV
jgi:hypothetical protein